MIKELDNLPNKSGASVSYGSGLTFSKRGKGLFERNTLLGLDYLDAPSYYDDGIVTSNNRSTGNQIIQKGMGYSIYADKNDLNDFDGTLVGIDLDQPTFIYPYPHNGPLSKDLLIAPSYNNYQVDKVLPIRGGLLTTDPWMMEHTMNGGNIFSSILNLGKKLFSAGKKIAPHIKKGYKTGKQLYDTGKQLHEFSKKPSLKNVPNLLNNIREGVSQGQDLIKTGKEAYSLLRDKPKKEIIEEEDVFHDAEGYGKRRRPRKRKGGKLKHDDIKSLLKNLHSIL